jgi:hypothetical protein
MYSQESLLPAEPHLSRRVSFLLSFFPSINQLMNQIKSNQINNRASNTPSFQDGVDSIDIRRGLSCNNCQVRNHSVLRYR